MNPSRELASPEALAQAAWDHLMALNRSLDRSRDVTAVEEGGHFRWHSNVPHEFYNGVVSSAAPDDRSPALVAATIESFRASGAPFAWWPTSRAVAGAWEPLLVAHGLTVHHDLPAMALEIEALPPDGGFEALDIRGIETDDELHQWARTFVEGNGLPTAWGDPFHRMYRDLVTPAGDRRCYVLHENGRPVATSSVFFADGVAGIYDVATLPDVRGRGYGGAITLAAVRAAREEGYRTAILQSSTLGLRVYERLGFRVVGHISYFLWKAPESAPQPSAPSPSAP